MILTRCVLRSSHRTMLLSLATASEQPDRHSAARRARRHCRGRLRLRLRWPLLAARAGLALRRRYAPPCPPLGSLRSPPRGSSWPLGWLRSACRSCPRSPTALRALSPPSALPPSRRCPPLTRAVATKVYLGFVGGFTAPVPPGWGAAAPPPRPGALPRAPRMGLAPHDPNRGPSPQTPRKS